MLGTSFVLPALLSVLAAPAPEPRFDLGLVEAYDRLQAAAVVAEPPVPDLAPSGRAPLSSFDEPGYSRRIALDLVDLGRAPLHFDSRQWRRFGLGLALVGAAALFDEELNERSDRFRDDVGVRIGRGIRPLGQEGGLALLGAAWLAGRGLEKPGLVAFAKDGLEAVILSSGVVVPALKQIAGRSRPRDADHPEGFAPFSGELSFPSGEASQAFAIAAVVAAHTDRKWLRYTAYGLAGLVSLARIELDGHWASDVVAGALVGHAIGRWVARRHAAERPDRESRFHFRLAPTYDRERHAWGLGGALSF